MVVVASCEPNVTPLLYGPRDDCPGCGESIYSTEHIQLLDHHVGMRSLSWTLYFCPLCNTTFKVYWPGWKVSAERIAAILQAERLAKDAKPHI